MLIRDRFPAYIGWDEFERNQRTLRDNSRMSQWLSAPRHGPSVLAGLVVCGRCGHRMLVGYANGPGTMTLRYSCQRGAIDYGQGVCQSLSGAVLESFGVQRQLQAVSPASLEFSLAAAGDIERERRQLDEHWHQRLTRSRYDVEQARRQYAAVDPEHRLVARELERRWDDGLRGDEQLRADYARFQRECPTSLSPAERDLIRNLAHDLPALWQAHSTTPEDRQTIARLLLEQVTVTVEGHTERVDVELRWVGGFVSCHTLTRPVQTYEQLSNYNELVARIAALRGERRTLSEIAATLNADGFRPPKRSPRFTKGTLSGFLREREVRAGSAPHPVTDERHLAVDEWWLANLAAELRMPIATLHRWQRVGWLSARKVSAAGGRWAIHADDDELLRLRRLRDCPRGRPRPYPRELTTPKPKIEESANHNTPSPGCPKVVWRFWGESEIILLFPFPAGSHGCFARFRGDRFPTSGCGAGVGIGPGVGGDGRAGGGRPSARSVRRAAADTGASLPRDVPATGGPTLAADEAGKKGVRGEPVAGGGRV